MAFMFTKDLETGNAQIDSEHKQLIQAVNDLLDACRKGEGRLQLNGSVEFLSNYTKKHFFHEEQLQLRYKYPTYDSHKKWHDGFIAEVDALMAKLKKEGPTIALVGEVNAKTSLLISHIKAVDSKLAKFISEQ